jgi:transketolase
MDSSLHSIDLAADRLAANCLRVLAIETVQRAQSGHPGLPLGAADLVSVLWTYFLKHNPADPTWPDRDRFVLSAGHGSALLYALLHLWGYPLSLADLQAFRQWGSATPGHPEVDPQRGIETTTGPLGQGLANAVGMALAERWLAAQFPALALHDGGVWSPVDHYTYVLAGDGDLMEGVSHEAASLAGHLRLGRLIVLYDDNAITIDGPAGLSCSDDPLLRFQAYGWQTLRCDGHDIASIFEAISNARAELSRPTLIACRTQIGYRSPRQGSSKAHGEPLGLEGVQQTRRELGWPDQPAFHVPAELYQRMAELRNGLAARQADWQDRQVVYFQARPDLLPTWEAIQTGRLPDGWQEALADFPAGAPEASRAASGRVLERLSGRLPNLLGGSADLTPSNNTRPKAARDLTPEDFSGNYLHYGVREHAMGAVMNGLALHGLRPYGGTFLVFSDYMRPAIRMAALMALPVIYIFTHDSIGLGEDGPTHQPVEQLTALRAIPNLWVIRPCDSQETAQAWKMALERQDGPTALILSRQALPQISQAGNDLAKGAYVLSDGLPGQPLKAILASSGSEVSPALLAQSRLAESGYSARVVSLPCWELFDRQPEGYRQAIFPAGVPVFSLEAGVTLAWARYTGASSQALGLDRFGASAPQQTLYSQFGLTAEALVERVCQVLQLA